MSRPLDPRDLPTGAPVNISRRSFLLGTAGASAGALVLGFGIPMDHARAAAAAPIKPGTRVPAFLEIRPDGAVRLLSPFMEGGQGIYTAMAQIVGEELDADPETFLVESAPTGPDYLVVNGVMRITGGSMSVRTSYETMRRVGAMASTCCSRRPPRGWACRSPSSRPNRVASSTRLAVLRSAMASWRCRRSTSPRRILQV
jgi:isoquinoline 1-oxidoreductase beta subunit